MATLHKRQPSAAAGGQSSASELERLRLSLQSRHDELDRWEADLVEKQQQLDEALSTFRDEIGDATMRLNAAAEAIARRGDDADRRLAAVEERERRVLAMLASHRDGLEAVARRAADAKAKANKAKTGRAGESTPLGSAAAMATPTKSALKVDPSALAQCASGDAGAQPSPAGLSPGAARRRVTLPHVETRPEGARPAPSAGRGASPPCAPHAAADAAASSPSAGTAGRSAGRAVSPSKAYEGPLPVHAGDVRSAVEVLSSSDDGDDGAAGNGRAAGGAAGGGARSGKRGPRGLRASPQFQPLAREDSGLAFLRRPSAPDLPGDARRARERRRAEGGAVSDDDEECEEIDADTAEALLRHVYEEQMRRHGGAADGEDEAFADGDDGDYEDGDEGDADGYGGNDGYGGGQFGRFGDGDGEGSDEGDYEEGDNEEDEDAAFEGGDPAIEVVTGGQGVGGRVPGLNLGGRPRNHFDDDDDDDDVDGEADGRDGFSSQGGARGPSTAGAAGGRVPPEHHGQFSNRPQSAGASRSAGGRHAW